MYHLGFNFGGYSIVVVILCYYMPYYRIAFKVKVKHWNCAHYCSERGARAAIMQAFSMRDFNFKSNSIVIFLYVLENLSSFNQVFFPRCMHFFSQKYAIFLKNMQFFSKICNFSQKYAIFSQKICIGKCLKFSYTYKKNAICITGNLLGCRIICKM